MLRRYYVQGDEYSNGEINTLLEAWLHADGSEENMSRVFDNHQDFHWPRYYYIYQSGRLKAPYGVMGPRSKTLARPLIRKCFPDEKDIAYAKSFGRDENEVRIKGAYSFLNAFLSHAPRVFSAYETDPFSWPRYGIDELEQYLEVCIGSFRDSYSVDAESTSSFFEHMSKYDPASLPDYKREYVPEFYARLTAIVESTKVSRFLERYSDRCE